MDFEINWRTIVDINPLRELKYPSYIMSLTCSLLANSQWIKLFNSRTNSFKYFWPYFDGMTIWRGNFFLISWSVVDFVYYFFVRNWHVSIPPQHIHEYFCLISEKQRQYPNALSQHVTYADNFFLVMCLQNL